VDAAAMLGADHAVRALRMPSKAGDMVAVVGIGGLGHLGVQYARHMGFEVAASGVGSGGVEGQGTNGEQARRCHITSTALPSIGQAMRKLRRARGGLYSLCRQGSGAT